MRDIGLPPSADSSLFSRYYSDPMSRLVKTTTLDKVKNDLLLHNEFARQEFNRKRKIIIRNTPVVTYSEVKTFMGRFAVADISISKRLQHAIVTLKNGCEAESAVEELRGTKLAGWDVQICLYRADHLLYVTGLSADIITNDCEFLSFVQAHGPVEKCFLMKSSNGQSKGYGLVEFAHNRDKSEQARCELDGLWLGSSSLPTRCQFVDESIASFDELHSQCLYVSNLPQDITEDELQSYFSAVAQPSSCQISRLDDKGFRFALVKYTTGIEAEYVMYEMKARQCSMSLEYCGPGETPSYVYISIRSTISKPLALHTVEVCPAVVNMLENNPQIIDYFKLLLCQLHKNVCQQPVPGGHPLHTGQSEKILLTNPSFQIALLAVIFAGQLQKHQALPNVGEPMMLQAAAMIEKHHPSSLFNLYGFSNSRLPGASMLTKGPMPTPEIHPVSACPLPPISAMLPMPMIACPPDLPSKTTVVSQYTVPPNSTSVLPGPSAIYNSKLSQTSYAPPSSMLTADSASLLDVQIPRSSYPITDSGTLPTSITPFNAVMSFNSNPSNGLRLPQSHVPPFITKPPMVSHPIPPTLVRPVNLFPPRGSLPVSGSSIRINSIPSLGSLPPPNLYPVPSSSSQVNSFLPQISPLPHRYSHPMPNTLMQINSVPPLGSLAFPNSHPLPSSSSQMNQISPLGSLPIPNSHPLPSSSVPIEPFPLLNSLPPPSSYPVLNPLIQNNPCPPLDSSYPLYYPVPSTTNLVSIQSLMPPLGSHLPKGDVSQMNWRPSNSFVPPSSSNTTSSHYKDEPPNAAVSSTRSQDSSCSKMPSLDEIPSPSKRKVPRAIFGRIARDGESRANQENHSSGMPLPHTARELPIINWANRALTESVVNIGKSAISVIGHKRAHSTIGIDDETQLPVTPVGMKPNFIPSPEPSPDGGYVGQHSQGIGGHYADSYFTKRRKITD